MGRPKKKVEEKKEEVKIKCTCCGKEKKVNGTYFYKSYSEIYKSAYDGRMTICKECVWELAKSFEERFSSQLRGIYELCKLLDIYYDKDLFMSVIEQVKSTGSEYYRIYFQKVLSLPQYKNKTFIDSALFEITDESKADNRDFNEKEVVKKWGKGFGSIEDYQWLEEDYNEWITHVNADKLPTQKIIQIICIKELEIRKARQMGKPTDKLEKSLRESMADASLTPKTMSEVNKTDSEKTFGLWLKDIENNRPAEYFEDKTLYEDYDHIGEYFERFVKRPLKNLLTGSRDFDKEFNVENGEE